MVNILSKYKKGLNLLAKLVLVFYFAVFPFGQLTRVSLTLAGAEIGMTLLDIVAGLFVFLYILGFRNKGEVNNKYLDLLIYVLFSFTVAVFILGDPRTIIGALYLLKLYSYFCMFNVVSYMLSRKTLKKSDVISIIKVSFVATLAIAFYQYFFIADLRPLYNIGWDDHLYRLTGALLDPGFTGLLIIFGFLLFALDFMRKKALRTAAISAFSLFSILLTYSRASFLALFASLFYLFLKFRKSMVIAVLVLAIIAIPFLPRPSSEGVKLERTYSIVSRLGSYQQALVVAASNPLFGVGYNNYCLVTQANFSSRSCSASDSSLLTLLATTGILGVVFFIRLIVSVFKNAETGGYGLLLKTSLVALFIHSLFVNSYFYPWVMGWLSVLLALGIKSLRSKG